MDTRKKPFYKKLQFWQILICAGVILTLVICIAQDLANPVTPAETRPPKETAKAEEPTIIVTEPIVETTQAPTEPPIPLNPYGPMDFSYENGYLTCSAGDAVLGIDVSTWQNNIDWKQVKEAGIEYAIIRVGYRSTDQGNLGMDSYAQINYEGATAAGIKVGVYFFSQAINVEEAREEANYVLEAVKDWDIQMPIVYDWEYVDDTARTANVDARTLTDCTIAFCETIQKAGYEPMIYFNRDQSHKQMFMEELINFRFWLAMYDQVMDYPYKIDMWQYTSSGSVPGINGDVDMNLYFVY